MTTSGVVDISPWRCPIAVPKISPFLLLLASILLCGFAGEGAGSTSPLSLPGYLPVEGGELYYEISGEGEPIVLVHDGLLHHVTWNRQFGVLAREHLVVRYDRRGYGNSSQPTTPYSDVEDLHQLFERLSLPPATLVGMSAGGGLSIDYALAHPEDVKMLVLIGAVVGGYGFTDHFFDRGGHLDPEIRTQAEAYRRYWVTDDPYEMAPENDAAKAEAARLIEASPQNLDTEKFRLRQAPDRPALPNLGEISVPTLVMVGEYDIPDVHAHAGAIEAGIPNAHRVIVRHAGHLVPIEQPDEFLHVFHRFLVEEPLFAMIAAEGPQAAAEEFERRYRQDAETTLFDETRMNAKGYELLLAGDVDGAIALFKLNVVAYPKSWNVYDSLGEAYVAKGLDDLAIQNYEHSLVLNPNNEGARRQLEVLRNRDQ